MKPRKKKSLGSLDSLLDTMTSVVGILLIMLIVIQLDVTNAVQRIISEQENIERGISDAQLAEMEQAKQALRATQKDLQNQLVTAREQRVSGSAEAQRLNQEIKTLQTQVDTRRSAAAAAEKKAAAARLLAAEAAKKKAEINKLKTEIAVVMTDFNDAKNTLRATPVPTALPAKVVKLPAPKAAPEGAKPIYVICREGLVAPVDQAGLIKAVKAAVEKSGLKPNDKNEYDGKKFESLFKARYVGDKDWRLKAVEAPNHRMRFHLYKQPRTGENRRNIQSQVSRYRLLLTRLNKKEHYLVFLVWPDSYDTYLMARSISNHHGFAAGWRPETTKEGWTPYLGNYLTEGYHESRPPPDPNAAAKPVDERPKPVDVID